MPAPSESCEAFACGDGTVFAESGPQSGQILDLRAGAESLVGLECAFLARQLNRRNLFCELTISGRFGGQLLATQGPFILLLSSDAGLLGGVLGDDAHQVAVVDVGEAVMEHLVDALAVAEFVSGPHGTDKKRGLAHALDPSGEDQIGVAGANDLVCEHRRLQPAATDLVDCDSGDGVVDAGRECDLPSGVLTAAGL